LRGVLTVSIAGLAATLIAVGAQIRANDARLSRAFNERTDRYSAELSVRVRQFEFGLRGVRGMVAAIGPERMTDAAFQRFMATRDMPREFPGALGFGYIARVQGSEIDAFLAHLQRRLDVGHGLVTIDQAHADEHFLVEFAEPVDRIGDGVGLDIATESRRRTAAIDAARSGEARVSAPIKLVKVDQTPTGFLMLLPLYAPELPQDTPEQRRTAVRGWAFAPLAPDIILASLVPDDDGIAVRVVDLDADQPLPFFTSPGFDAAGDAVWRRSQEIHIYGRTWRLEARRLPHFSQSLELRSPAVRLFEGAALTALLAFCVHLLGSAALRRRQHRLEQAQLLGRILDAAPQALVVSRPNGRIVHANAAAQQLLAAHGEPLSGRAIDDCLIDDDERVSPEADPSQAGQRTVMRGMAVTRDGGKVRVQIVSTPFESAGETWSITGIHDIELESRMLAALQDSEQRWRTIANAMPQLVWTCSSEGDFDFVSEQWSHFTGADRDALAGDRWLDWMHPDDRLEWQRIWAQAFADGQAARGTYRLRRADGVYRWFDAQAVPISSSDGAELRGWVGAHTDIQERVEAEEALQRLNDDVQRDFHAILDALPSPVSAWDGQARNRFANVEFSRWFAMSPADLQGKSKAELLGPQFEESRPLFETTLSGTPTSMERELSTPDGKRRHVQSDFVPQVMGGEVRGVYVLDYDVTEIRAAQQAAVAATEAKSAFLANMSHEIRTPMNAVINLVYLLQQCPLGPKEADLLSKVNVAARSLIGVINDVLDLSKIEAGEMPIVPEVIELRSHIDDLMGMMEAGASEKGLRFSLSVDAAVPARVTGDPMRLSQILSNLLSNAIKFTAAGEVALRVDAQANGRLRFTVTDTGIGIDEANLARLFRPFAQADSSITRRFGGTGLGLALVARLVGLMGGQVGADSVIGKGSRFWFSLPLPAVVDGQTDSGGPHALRVLVVDDDPAQQRVLAGVARDLGWSAETVASAGEAIDRVSVRADAGTPFELLIADWQLKGIDGIALSRILRNNGFGEALTIVLVTARPLSELLQARTAGQVDACLPKPLTASALFDAAHAALARRAAGVRDEKIGRQDNQRLAGRRLLLVDDSSINLEVGMHILERAGARVVTASNGAEALEALRDSPESFDLVLMDIQMPTMYGYEATRRIRADLGLTRLPIVALTAGALVSERTRALDAGMTDFVGKPFNPDATIHLIAGLTGSASPRKARRPAIEGAADRGAWPPLEGVDIDDVRERLGDDRQLFIDVLGRLLVDYRDLGMVDRKSPDRRAIIATELHKLSGTAGALGATAIAADAARLQRAVEADPDFAIDVELKALRARLARLSADFDDWFAESQPLPEPG